jgi:hypothetical protein
MKKMKFCEYGPLSLVGIGERPQSFRIKFLKEEKEKDNDEKT